MAVLVLESSTTSAKAALVNPVDGIIAIKSAAYAESVSLLGVQNPEGVFESLISIGRDLVRQSGVTVDAVALSGIWHSLVCLDELMSPIGASYNWEYTAGAKWISQLRADNSRAWELYRQTGCVPHSTFGPYIYYYIRNNMCSRIEPEPRFFTMQGGYNFFRLTGEFVLTDSIASGNSLLNIECLEYSPMILELTGWDKSQLPELVRYDHVGSLSSKAAEFLGVKTGIPVIPALPDGGLNQVGECAIRSGIMTMSVGTSAAMRLAVDQPHFLEGSFANWNYYAPTTYLTGCAIAGGTNCIDRFRQAIGWNERPYSCLDELILPAESETPVFLPFWFGERCPGWHDERVGGFFEPDGQKINGSGVLCNLDSLHAMKNVNSIGEISIADRIDGLEVGFSNSLGYYYTGLLEGICFNLKQCYNHLVSRCGQPDQIILSGGILQSVIWRQMLADILEQPLTVSRNSQASIFGAARVAWSVLNIANVNINDSYSSYNVSDCIPGEKTLLNRIIPQKSYSSKYENYVWVYNSGEKKI